MLFIWDDWNVEHIGKHGVEPHGAEEVVRSAKRPYPRSDGGDKFIVRGRTDGRRLLQVVYVHRESGTIDVQLLEPVDRLALLAGEIAFYVIHARELRRGEK